jgi:hypothetical protein
MPSQCNGREDSRQTTQRGHVSGVGRPEEFEIDVARSVTADASGSLGC